MNHIPSTYEGVTYTNTFEQKAPQEFKQRRNFGERPVFGTVTDLYSGGEKGLITGGPEDEAVAEQQQERDWEKALTYGKAKKR